LFCQECPRVSGDAARGWRLYRVDDPEEDSEPKLAAYCPTCAAGVFGPVRFREDDDQ
jgi:hypothetical protein